MKTSRMWAVVMLSVAIASAQSSSSLSGVVTDPSSAVVPRAELTLTNPDTNQHRTVFSDAQGRYAFSQIQPSNYEVAANAAGFSKLIVHNVQLLVNTPATVDIHFEVGTV